MLKYAQFKIIGNELDKVEEFEYNMCSLNKKQLIAKIHSMDKKELADLVRQALDESGIPYEIGKLGGVVFHGLLEEDSKKSFEKNT